MFLDPVFPKTSHLAQYHGVTGAARRLHDEHIGVGNVFHLFRLPEEVEKYLHSAMLAGRGESNLLTGLDDMNAALRVLTEVSDGTRGPSEGPTSVGVLKDIFTNPAIRNLAQCYLAAFQGGIKTYPYFMI